MKLLTAVHKSKKFKFDSLQTNIQSYICCGTLCFVFHQTSQKLTDNTA